MTPSDLEFYRTHGFVFTPPIFSSQELDKVIAAQDQFYGGIHGAWPFKKVPICGWTPGQDSKLRKNDFTQVMVPEIRELILNPKLGEWASFLCGENVRLFQDQLSYKEPEDLTNKTIMGWHNDRQYWGSCSSENMLTAWIPLVDMEVDLGPIMFMDGSHAWPSLKEMDFFSTDLSGLERKMEEKNLPLKRVPAILKKGQVSFHHCKTLHGSGPNTSSRARRALAVHLQPVSNRPEKNQIHIAKLLASELGQISFDHPLLFPLLGGQA